MTALFEFDSYGPVVVWLRCFKLAIFSVDSCNIASKKCWCIL